MGKLVLIEGTDCSGKETQSKLLIDNLKKKGYKAVYVSFPDYDSPTGKIVGGPYLGKEEICESYFSEGPALVDAKVASLYYAADRVYHLEALKKVLNENDYVILDRYVYSNMAHQGGKISDRKKRNEMYEWLYHLEFEMLDLVKPDLIYFLHMPYEEACLLKKNRVSLDGHEKDSNHLKNAEMAYLELKDKYNFIYISCVDSKGIKSIDEIGAEIIKSMI